MSDAITIAEYVKDVLNAAINAGSGDAVEVKRAWELTHDLANMTGRKIDVYPVGYADGGPVTRGESFSDVTITTVIIERYEGDLESSGGDNPIVPVEWVDERVNFVSETVVDVLGSVTETVLVGSTDSPFKLGEWWTETQVVTQICDPDFLRMQKVFWSEVETTFRRIARN